jgi:hypothetical protein
MRWPTYDGSRAAGIDAAPNRPPVTRRMACRTSGASRSARTFTGSSRMPPHRFKAEAPIAQSSVVKMPVFAHTRPRRLDGLLAEQAVIGLAVVQNQCLHHEVGSSGVLEVAET